MMAISGWQASAVGTISAPFSMAATTFRSGSSSMRATSAPRTIATSSASRILNVSDSRSKGLVRALLTAFAARVAAE